MDSLSTPALFGTSPQRTQDLGRAKILQPSKLVFAIPKPKWIKSHPFLRHIHSSPQICTEASPNLGFSTTRGHNSDAVPDGKVASGGGGETDERIDTCAVKRIAMMKRAQRVTRTQRRATKLGLSVVGEVSAVGERLNNHHFHSAHYCVAIKNRVLGGMTLSGKQKCS